VHEYLLITKSRSAFRFETAADRPRFHYQLRIKELQGISLRYKSIFKLLLTEKVGGECNKIKLILKLF